MGLAKLNTMTIVELQIQLDIYFDDKANVLKDVAYDVDEGFFFVDSEDGHCYLFDRYGNLDDIAKVKTLRERYIKKDIKKIIIPNSVIDIGDYAFHYYSSLMSVTIPNSVKNIGINAFWNCSSLTNMVIGNGVIGIGHWAFDNCIGLTSVTIPNSVISIGYSVFYDCHNLKSLIFKGKTLRQVKKMNNYPFGIEDESIIKCKS